MKMVNKKIGLYFSLIMLSAIIVFFPRSGYAVNIFGNGILGSFEGELTYNAISSVSGTLTLALKNTSPVANGGYLTAFAFNNPGNRITSALFSKTDPDFKLIGGGFPHYFSNGINASPYGYFDIGATTNGGFQGGGNPNKGIAVGVTETFTFGFTGVNLDQLSEDSFISELSTGNNGAFFAARFRGFNDLGSDKVPGDVAPEPTTLSLLGLGLLGLLGFKKKKV